MKRTKENQALHDTMMKKIVVRRKWITVNGKRVETDVKECPAFDPRALVGFESGENLAKVFNVKLSVGIRSGNK